jgi:SAM-dependent methyltransferase
MEDIPTVAYFDSYTPEYSTDGLDQVAAAINRYGTPDCTLVDIGCGTGKSLAFLKSQTRLKRLIGIDVSSNSLAKAKERSDCDALQGSILDANFVDCIVQRFDFALLAAVLHHLIGRTRTESRKLALQALTNSLRLLKSGGILIVVEPTYYPSFTMDIVFWIKKAVTTVTSNRVAIGSYWNNIGAPVVSYYTTEELQRMIREAGDTEIIGCERVAQKLNWIHTAAMITRQEETTHIVRKRA